MHSFSPVLVLLWTGAMACGDSTSSRLDAALSPTDAPLPDPGVDAASIIGPADAAGGITGGSACDASDQCLSGACTLGVCSDWRRAMRIRIDTTQSGADVSEAVTDFPLLVRLTGDAGPFGFDQARDDGRDIRFVDDKGRNLGYQIDRWRRDERQAELWVSVPRIEGNSRANTVIMYWGNERAPAVSSGAAVFGAYDCVYHMNAPITDSGTVIEDGSGHNVDGTTTPIAVETSSDGVVAYGLRLGGDSGVATSRALDWRPAFSTSLWFKAPSGAKGGLAAFYWPLNTGTLSQAVVMNADGTLSFSVTHRSNPAVLTTLASFDDDAWHFLTATLSSSGQYLFVDGESAVENPTLTSADSGPKSYWYFGLSPSAGAGGGGGTNQAVYLRAQLDEIRVQRKAESAAWVRLAYATQRPGSTAVTFEAIP